MRSDGDRGCRSLSQCAGQGHGLLLQELKQAQLRDTVDGDTALASILMKNSQINERLAAGLLLRPGDPGVLGAAGRWHEDLEKLFRLIASRALQRIGEPQGTEHIAREINKGAINGDGLLPNRVKQECRLQIVTITVRQLRYQFLCIFHIQAILRMVVNKAAW